MPKTRSGVHGAAAGPAPQAAIKDLLRSLRPEEAKKALEDASKALAAAKPSAKRKADAELGVEAVARVPAKASVKLLGPVVVVLVDLRLAGVDDRVGLVGAVLCVLVAGREGLDICEGFLVGEGAD